MEISFAKIDWIANGAQQIQLVLQVNPTSATVAVDIDACKDFSGIFPGPENWQRGPPFLQHGGADVGQRGRVEVCGNRVVGYLTHRCNCMVKIWEKEPIHNYFIKKSARFLQMDQVKFIITNHMI